MSGRPLRIVGADELRRCIHFEDLIEPVAQAFRDTSAGLAQNGLITLFPGRTAADGDVYVKAGAVPGRATYIAKVSPWFAANVAAGRAQGGFVAVFDATTGQTVALLEDEHYLSDIRTAAAGALAVRLLARPRIDCAAVFGTGVQAYWQALAAYRERPFHTLLVWGRDTGKAEALRSRLRPDLPQVEILTTDDAERAVGAADLIVTATQAREPIVRGAWLRPGQHITAVGADDATKCELDPEALTRARVIVDERGTALANGDVYRAVQAGAYAPGRIAGELGEVLLDEMPGRISDADITIAKLVGIGAQDLAAAETAVALLNRPAR